MLIFASMDFKNDLLLRAARGENIERYPVWLMRQAGRILPEYRAVRNSLSGFKELVETPALAAEVTIQPVDHLGVDAAIIFSDILVIPEAMGLEYQLIEKVGPRFEKTIKTEADLIKHAETDFNVEDRLGYVKEAIEITTKELNGRVPLIGFAGAPWTIFCYMIDGGGSKTFSESRKMIYQNPALAHELLGRITEVTIRYLKMQIKAGANLVQVFDSWAGILGNSQYKEFGLKYINKIADAINEVPVTIFAKGAYQAMPSLAQSNCNTLGMDWNMEVSEIRAMVGEDKTLQGNLDPCALYSTHSQIEQLTNNMLDSFKSKRHIVNLGHGVYPDIDPEKVKTFIKTVKNYEIKH
ncbi:uroporphyrinogen decarboxylase [Brumimicrobium mesophilum]|uniref:uroporphyrinogen decarboxylase n=1 Tax=Brumimicrobium mesophilum TaxID=392717 RepID=UPI001F28FAC6|nr:uroporphyrinogen decarboxylase [Brumimicrobium mesophilum]